MGKTLIFHHEQLRRAGFFATMGGRGAERAMTEMKMLCDAHYAPTQAFVERQIKEGTHRVEIDEFVAALSREGRNASISSHAAS